MTHNNLSSFLSCFLLLAGLALSIISCNKKDEESEVKDNYVTTESVAITAFSLSPDIRIMKNLDSVYFSIDLEHGVVFNADSLPKGTNVTKLVPKISYPSTVTSAVIEMTGGTHREGTSNYFSNASDTIDFTGKVTLTLGTAKDEITKTYVLKVNVHKEDPDTLFWDRMGSSSLPSRLPSPKAQKSVVFGSGVLSLIEEADGTYTVAVTDDIFKADWKKNQVTFDHTPDLPSLTAGSDGNLYLLSDGNLLQSADGLSWEGVAAGWGQIIGSYGQSLLGVSGRTMVSWPDNSVESVDIPADFPVSGYTAPLEFDNRWSSQPTIILFGGRTSSGDLSTRSWAFDGSNWADIADNPLPPLEGLSVVSYFSYLNSASNGLLKEFEAYLAFGGKDADGRPNETVYVTYDHGISWQRAQQYMQLPQGITAGYMVDALSLGTAMESSLSNRWKAKRRLPYEIDGDLVKWNCPYIFLFGGYDPASQLLNPNIRSGVLQRLTFEPLF